VWKFKYFPAELNSRQTQFLLSPAEQPGTVFWILSNVLLTLMFFEELHETYLFCSAFQF
jgi:hypothetical protein